MDINRDRLHELLTLERKKFIDTHPKSQELFLRSKKSLLAGVPMSWMVRWAGDFPVFVASGNGAHFVDVDGRRYVDFCLGDSAAMTGHAPNVAIDAIVKRQRAGHAFMLPTEDCVWVGEELSRRFGLPFWQIAMTATDANRFVIRLARQITGRKKILVFNWAYHGTVDEALVTLDAQGKPVPRAGNIGHGANPADTTKVIEFNDVAALEAALRDESIACVLAEPVMTNIGIIHPAPGYHAALRALTRKYGSLLVIDETHTICAGPGGYTALHGLEPDFFVIGKPIGSGVPVAAYGMSESVARRVRASTTIDDAEAANDGNCDVSGIGGTLSGNALALAAVRVTLTSVLTPAAFRHTIALADRFRMGVEQVIAEFKLPWIVKQLGARVEYWFTPTAPVNGREAAAAVDADLDRFMHLFALNRGILMTPFHNMALIAPQATAADVDHHTKVFREAVALLLAPKSATTTTTTKTKTTTTKTTTTVQPKAKL